MSTAFHEPMKLSISHTTSYQYQRPAYDSHTTLHLRPRATETQRITAFSFVVQPRTRIREFTDYYGNWVATLSIPYLHREQTITAVAEVETVMPLRPRLPTGPLALKLLLDPSFQDAFAEFLAPTGYVPLHTYVRAVADGLRLQAGNDVTALLEGMLDYLHREFTYEAGVTDVRDTIDAMFEAKRGVCQDYAHVVSGIARALGIPARYVSGYLQTPGTDTVESHAWAELYIPGRGWWGIDGTGPGPVTDRYVVLGWGRDYADVAPVQGIIRGGGRQQMSVAVRMQEIQAQQ